MHWQNLTIGKRIATGFGIIIVFLILLGVLSFSGVAGIVENASEVISGNALDAEFAQKEVDHLNWAGNLNKLLTDVTVSELTVEIDHTKCGLGKWLYGERRVHAEAMIPSLAPLLKKVEGPHEQLHASAAAIGRVYSAADPELPGRLCTMLTQHLLWAEGISGAILDNAPSIDVQTNHTLCEFGKWLNSEAAKKAGESDAGMGRLLEQIKAPHQKLHDSAKKIISSYRPVHEGLHTNLLMRLNDHRKWVAVVAEGIIQSTQINAETNPAVCGLGKWLASDEIKTLSAADDKFADLFEKIKRPHAALHQSVIQINDAIDFQDPVAAKEIFRTETKPNLKKVAVILGEIIPHEAALADGRSQAVAVFKSETTPDLIVIKDLLIKMQARAQTLLEGQFKAADIYSTETSSHLKTVQTLLGTLRSTVKENMLTDRAMLTAAGDTRRNVMIIALVAIGLGLFMAFFISRGIITVLKQITGGMGQGADQVTSAAGQVSASSQSLAEGASEQAASIEETSSSMEEMSAMTRKNAENADHADRLTRDAGDVVQRANASMGQLTQSMDEISKASEETFKIIKTIDEIAFQTNLLALNASVEAARAGEAGAGFAVVADEVRNLAMRAADAAKNTAGLIEGTVKKVNDGSQIVVDVNAVFQKMAESVTKVGQLVSEISGASNEQSEGIVQVNTAVAEMDKVVQQNAANAEESAAAAEEMSAQSEQLKEYVDEMIRLVSGGQNQGAHRDVYQHSAQGSRRLLPALQAEKKNKERRPISGGKEVKPENIIPFDDDDADGFSDF